MGIFLFHFLTPHTSLKSPLPASVAHSHNLIRRTNKTPGLSARTCVQSNRQKRRLISGRLKFSLVPHTRYVLRHIKSPLFCNRIETFKKCKATERRKKTLPRSVCRKLSPPDGRFFQRRTKQTCNHKKLPVTLFCSCLKKRAAARPAKRCSGTVCQRSGVAFGVPLFGSNRAKALPERAFSRASAFVWGKNCPSKQKEKVSGRVIATERRHQTKPEHTAEETRCGKRGLSDGRSDSTRQRASDRAPPGSVRQRPCSRTVWCGGVSGQDRVFAVNDRHRPAGGLVCLHFIVLQFHSRARALPRITDSYNSS